mgnify:CR=1 FL=1
MKIEKGKLYYDTKGNRLVKSNGDGFKSEWNDKIAVYCPSEGDWDYVNKVTGWEWNFARNYVYRLLDNENVRAQDLGDDLSYHIITIDQFKEFYPPISEEEQDPYVWGSIDISNKTKDNVQNTQPHYDNTHGSLYKIAEQRGWNSYQFDIVKRIDRALKKGQFKEDLQKTKDLIDLWLREVK